MTISELNEIIRKMIAERDVADPYALMPYVLDEIACADYRAALALCLPAQIKRVIQGRRARAIRLTPTLSEQTRIEEERPGTHVETVADWLRQIAAAGLLEQAVPVAGEWKRLGDCTSAELRTVAAALRSQGYAHLRRAKFYDGLAARLDAERAATLSDLAAEQPAAAAAAAA